MVDSECYFGNIRKTMVCLNRVYTAVTWQENGWWIGWIEEVPGVNCQEKTHEKLLETLKATLKETV
jgi:predicted RNase H-like HicB family nuclease